MGDESDFVLEWYVLGGFILGGLIGSVRENFGFVRGGEK